MQCLQEVDANGRLRGCGAPELTEREANQIVAVGLLAALAQLGYLMRISGDPCGIRDVRARIEHLAERHPPAAPFLSFCDAWIALVEFDPARQLAAVEATRNDDIPPVWRATRDHLRGHARPSLGRPDIGLELVPADIASLPVSIPGALATRSQCRWMAGHPHEALADPPAGLSDRHGGRDRSIAGSWIGFMRAHSGDAAGAREAVAAAQEALGDEPDAQNAGQAAAVGLVIDLIEGHEAKAAEGFAGAPGADAARDDVEPGDEPGSGSGVYSQVPIADPTEAPEIDPAVLSC